MASKLCKGSFLSGCHVPAVMLTMLKQRTQFESKVGWEVINRVAYTLNDSFKICVNKVV